MLRRVITFAGAVGALALLAGSSFAQTQVKDFTPGVVGHSGNPGPVVQAGGLAFFAAQEAQYQALLQAGARVPDQKPEMQLADRGPALAVGIAVAVIAAFIVTLFVMFW